MSSLFKYSKLGLLANVNSKKISYSGYIISRNKKNTEFYGKRKKILVKQFIKLLTPSVLKLSELFGDQALKILDLGCGDGVVLEALDSIRKGNNIKMYLYGLDLDEKSMAKIRCSSNKIIASATEIPLANESMSMVISSQMIEHLTVQDVRKVFSEVKRVLRPKGVFYIETPNPSSLLAKLMGKSWWMYLPEHLVLIPPKILSQILVEHGFVEVAGKTRMEIDEQINEVNEIIKRLPRLVQLIPLRLLAFIFKNYILVSERGSITVIMAKRS